jgi:DNA integrity scanning protein DisA with diadenylate cyclase activity
MTGNGYGVSTLGRITTGSIAISKVKSSTQRSRISLTRQKRSGIRRSQLNKIRGKQPKQELLEKTAGLSLLLINLYKKMIEAFIPALVAVATGVAVLFNKVNHRVTVLDSRVDKLELKLVESFTTKADFASAMERMEQHLMRIEDKMDKLVDKKCTT